MALKVRRAISLLICGLIVYAGFAVGHGLGDYVLAIVFAVAIFAFFENAL